MKFRKRPIVIEANRFYFDIKPWPYGVKGDDYLAWVDTLEGQLNVADGDWIVVGIKGEIYPCKPDIFELTYKPFPREGGEMKTHKNKIIFNCSNYRPVTIARPPHCYNCIMREGYPVNLGGDKYCRCFKQIPKKEIKHD